MPELLKNIDQDKYNRLATEYIEELGNQKSPQYLSFFATVQKRVEVTLKDKFIQLGVEMIREDENKKLLNKPAMRYRLVALNDPTKTKLIHKLLNMSTILQDIRLIDSRMSSTIPDVKIIVPEYLNAKIEEVTDRVIFKFKTMLRERINNIKKELPEPLKQLLTVEGTSYAKKNDASFGDSKTN